MNFPILKYNRTRARLIAVTVICLVAALAFELLFANFNLFFRFDKTNEERALLPYHSGAFAKEDGRFVLPPSNSGTGVLYFENVPGGISSITFDIRYTDKSVKDILPAPSVTVTATDPRTTWSGGGFITVITETFAVGENGRYESVALYPSIVNDASGDLRLSFSNLKGIVELQNVRINVPPAFSFSLLRFAVVFLLLLTPAFLSIRGLFFGVYDPSSRAHRYGVKTAVLFTLLLSLFFVSAFLNKNEAIPYPLEGAVRYYQPYVQQFDALMKGQLHLDVPVSDELLALENPYDYLSRVDADPLWDRAFFEGKYYSYFGVTPLLVVYFPYYLLTGALPSDAFVLSFFLFITAVFIPLCVLKWVDLHEKRRLPLSVVYLGAITAFVGSMMLLIARSVTPFYYIATLSANAFLSIFLYLILKAVECKRLRDRAILYALAGLAYALVLHSRLNVALLGAFIVIPYLIFRVLKRRESEDAAEASEDTVETSEGTVETSEGTAEIEGTRPGRREAVPSRLLRSLSRLRSFFAPLRELLISSLALGLPVLVGLIALLSLNHLRFGSILEFGTSYQLTVSDVRYNVVTLSDLFPAVYHYFFQDLETSAFFPFFSIGRESLSDYGRYVYTDSSFGLFSLPLFCSLFASPALLFLKDRTRYEKLLLIFLILGLFTVALFNFSLGGVIFRYVADLTLLASLGSVFLCFALLSDAPPAKGDGIDGGLSAVDRTKKRALTVAVLLFFVASCTVALLLSISYNGNLTKYASGVFISVKRFFSHG